LKVFDLGESDKELTKDKENEKSPSPKVNTFLIFGYISFTADFNNFERGHNSGLTLGGRFRPDGNTLYKQGTHLFWSMQLYVSAWIYNVSQSRSDIIIDH
jgi:hypothetical protein